MEYPGTKFTRPIRLTLLVLCVVLFFIISPTIILYTAGYRYDWHNGLLKETGSINIDIEPEDTEVYLNGIRLQEKLPIRLNNIVPAKYNLRIAASGYLDWTKEIEVKNKQTYYIKDIRLLKKNKPQLLVNEKIDNFFLSYNGQFILYSLIKGNDTEIWLRNNNLGQNILISTINTRKPLDIIWAEKNNYALITAAAENGYASLLVVNASNPSRLTDLTQILSGIKKVQWSNTIEPQLYYGTGENIYAYSPITSKSQVITENKYVDWHMENGQLWTIQNDISKQEYVIIKNTLGFSSEFNRLTPEDLDVAGGDITSETKVHILIARQETALIKTEKNSKMILTGRNYKYKIQADKFFISKFNNWWLLWSPLELWSYSQNEEPYLLSRSGEHLEQVVPLDEHNTLGLTWADKTAALFPYYLVGHEIINEKIKKSAADSENKIFYFIPEDKNKPGIWKLNY